MANHDSDAIVVGVGGMGSSVVYWLARRGLDVIGLESFDIPHAKGSSHGLTRIIRLPQYEDPAYVPLVQRSLDLWTKLDSQYRNQLFYQTGTIDFGPVESDVFEGSKESCHAHDIPHDILSGAELCEQFPGYSLPDDYQAVYQPDGGFLHAEQCVVAHAEAAHRYGATIRARERVTDWDTRKDGVQVSTDRATYSAEKLVVTAGAWTGQLLPTLAPYLQPERQVLGWFQPTVTEQFSPEQFPVFVADAPSGHYYGFPIYEVPGFKLGKFNHRRETGSPAELESEPTREDEDLLRQFAKAYFPTGTGPTMQLTTCMFTNTPDNDFIIDTHPENDSIVIGAGFSGHGFKFASVIGEIIADIVVNGNTNHPINNFRISRFG